MRAQWRATAAPQSANPLLAAPILSTLLRLTLPNLAAMLVIRAVAIAETTYVGILGTAQLAAIALVFPMVMLMQMLSAGAMGGGVSSAISRALGAGDEARAEALALHAPSSARRPVRPSRCCSRLRGGDSGRWAAVARCSSRRSSTPTWRWRASADLAGQHAGLRGARHRQHARALGDPAWRRGAADRARRRTRAWARADPALRPRRRRLRPGDRLRCRRV